jgi:translation initiation factor 2D
LPYHSHPDLSQQNDHTTRSTGALYTLAEVKSALLAYVDKHELVNHADQQYLNVSADALFSAALYGAPNAKGAAPVPEFARREEALNALRGRMQPWYRIAVGGEEPFTKKGALRPIHIATKSRQGRKTCTFITGFEQFQLSGDALAEALRVRCASSTSGMYCLVGLRWSLFFSLPDMLCIVSPVAGGAHELMVQGKQTSAVLELLGSLGVPEKWIEVSNIVGKKK